LWQTTKQTVKIQSAQRSGGIRFKEVRLTKDSYGNREKITTRLIGEKAHCVNKKTDFHGYSEKEERFENFDEGYEYEKKYFKI